MNDDWRLLEAYAARRDQAAFAALVAKYADLVFHAAVRRTRDRALAEDVTQAVFIALARSAGHLRRTGSLAGWLHKTALLAGATALRNESRLKRRERRAARNESLVAANQNTEEPAAIVEQELHRLREADRQILCLHYLEDRPMPQTAQVLGISLEAARKRLTRALTRLRGRLAARGISTTNAESTMVALTSTSARSLTSVNHITTIAIAGGKNGNAFALASDVLRSLRLQVLARAAMIAIVAIPLIATAVAIAMLQPSKPPSNSQRTSEAAPQTVAFTAPTTKPTTLPGKAIELPENIRLALVKNSEQIGPISIAVTMTSQSRYSVEEAMKTLKMDEWQAAANANSVWDMRASWQERKYRSWFHEPQWPGMPENHVKDLTLEGTFDGETIYSGDVTPQPNDPNVIPTRPILFKGPPAARATSIDALDGTVWFHAMGYFDSAGIHLPVTLGDLKDNSPAQSTVLRRLERGAKLIDVTEVELSGHKVVRLRLVAADPDRQRAMRTDPDQWYDRMRKVSVDSDEQLRAVADVFAKERALPEFRYSDYYLDPQLHYALRRAEELYLNENQSSTLLLRVDCDRFERLKDRDTHLPRRINYSRYTSTMLPGQCFKEPTGTIIYDVTELKLDPIPEDQFVLDYKQPGTKIIEYIDANTRREFEVLDDGLLRERER